MKSIQVKYDPDKDVVKTLNDKNEEDWAMVCEKYDDDVHRIKEIKDDSSFSALYECCDADNVKSYFLVDENKELFKLRHKNMRNKLGFGNK